MAAVSTVPQAEVDSTTDTENALETERMLAAASPQRTTQKRPVLVGLAVAAFLGAAATLVITKSSKGEPADWQKFTISAEHPEESNVVTWDKMGCTDWKEATIVVLSGMTKDLCDAQCGITPNCEYSNYQPGECGAGEGVAAGTCYLFSKCEMEPNSCWVLSNSSGPTPDASSLGCADWKTSRIEVIENVTKDDCDTACGITGGCKHTNYQPGQCGTSQGVAPGTCYLFSSCKTEPNDCWVLTNISGPELYSNQPGQGCANWKDIKIGDAYTGLTVDECGKLCAANSTCAQFNIQTSSCKDGIAAGACYLFQAGCELQANDCWDLYTPETSTTGEDAMTTTM